MRAVDVFKVPSVRVGRPRSWSRSLSF